MPENVLCNKCGNATVAYVQSFLKNRDNEQDIFVFKCFKCGNTMMVDWKLREVKSIKSYENN